MKVHGKLLRVIAGTDKTNWSSLLLVNTQDGTLGIQVRENLASQVEVIQPESWLELDVKFDHQTKVRERTTHYTNIILKEIL